MQAQRSEGSLGALNFGGGPSARFIGTASVNHRSSANRDKMAGRVHRPTTLYELVGLSDASMRLRPAAKRGR